LRKFAWENIPDETLKARPLKSADLLRGWFPELVTEKGRDAALWYSSYLQTYIERDVRTLRNIGDLTQFQIFLRVLASRSAQLLDISGISRDIGVAVNTVKAWISVLEATYQIFILRPYFANIGKRLVKSPKVYFTDTGLLCHLTGIRDAEHAIKGPMGGALFETAVLMEIIKTYLNQGIEPQIYFFRTATGTEVDLIIEDGQRLIPIEAKLTSTPRTEFASAIQKFMADIKKPAPQGYVVYNGDMMLPLAPQIKALPFSII
jgi:predicted AAA+ superfamily ATPase